MIDVSGVLALVCLTVGTLLMLLASVGVLRMPDVFMRMQAATKASSLGAALVLVGVALRFGTVGSWVRVVAIVVFLFMTTPIAAHLIARASYHVGTPLWDRTGLDELRGRYREDRETPEGSDPSEAPMGADGSERDRSR